jgi:hypothetical protein
MNMQSDYAMIPPMEKPVPGKMELMYAFRLLLETFKESKDNTY